MSSIALPSEMTDTAKAIVNERRSRNHIIIGSRKSDLAMWQARHVHATLTSAYPGHTFEIKTEATVGDHVLDSHLATLAAANPGIFTKELEVGLFSGAYDLAVHSLKDMPTTLPPGLQLFGISEREDPRDVVILAARHNASGVSIKSISDVPAGWVIGTSSLRREALLKRLNPQVIVQTVRGNLNTRFKKLDATAEEASAAGHPHYDALILAAAGVKRLGWWDRASLALEASEWPYGVGQGALGIEGRADDALIQEMALRITDLHSALMCLAERYFLNKLQGGCQVPIGVHSHVSAASSLRAGVNSTQTAVTVTVAGTVLALDGSREISGSASEVVQHAVGATAVPALWEELLTAAKSVGGALSERLLRAGAAEILGPLTASRPITYGAAEVKEE